MTVGKAAARAKKRVGYEAEVPACDRCVHFRGQHMQLVNSTPQWYPHRCMLHHFNVQARGCCDLWKHKITGETLADDPVNTEVEKQKAKP